MNRRLQACLVLLMMAAITGAVFAQSGVSVPLQRGVSVQLVVTSNAVAVPNADQPDALVVALTADGSIYLRANRVPNA
jgi:biopolymer transport protein ExbD